MKTKRDRARQTRPGLAALAGACWLAAAMPLKGQALFDGPGAKPPYTPSFEIAPAVNAGYPNPNPNAPVNKPPPGPGKPGKGKGDPVDVISGAVFRQEKDIVIPCPLIDLEYWRSYNSDMVYDGPQGQRWTHSYDWSLWKLENFTLEGVYGTWVYLQALSDPAQPEARGRYHWFLQNADGTYTLHGDSGYKLVKLSSGWLEVRVPGGLIYRFDSDGVLRKIEHPAGPSVSLVYNGVFPGHKLVRIEHSNGKYLSLTYDELVGHTRISRVDTPSPDYWMKYEYNEHNELVRVVKHTRRGEFKTTYAYDLGVTSPNY